MLNSKSLCPVIIVEIFNNCARFILFKGINAILSIETC